MRSHSYLNTSKSILQSYDGSIPLAQWLKQYFKTNKKFGSTDRKQIAHLCYSFYRLGNAFKEKNTEERILIAVFLSSIAPNKVLQELKPEWDRKIQLPLEEKLDLLSAREELSYLFPLKNYLSKEIDEEQFSKSLLIQPDLYLRIRPGKKEEVLKKLQNAGLDFDLPDPDCIRLPNQTKIDELINVDEEVLVQDYNSQQVLEPLKSFIDTKKPSVWDCCAGSGGKSILFYDQFPPANLTVSDMRESILLNLKNRFKRASIKNYKSFVADISIENFSLKEKFDIVICDAPCTGSGTWSRTPEQLSFFKDDKINYYSTLQHKIVLNAGRNVKKGGVFLYITCSVFEKENEEVLEFMQQNLPLQLKTMQYLKGYDKKADSLFIAVFSAL